MILAIANQKGGVGKTTTAINLGAGLGALERRVLLVDCDPQGNATRGLGGKASPPHLYHALTGEIPLQEAIRPHFAGRVFETVVPRNVRLAEAPSHGLPIFQYDIKSRGAEAYLAVARELLRRAA